jgi:hypothetical protein
MKGTKFPIHFIFDTLGLNGYIFRKEDTTTPNELEYIKPLRLHEFTQSAVINYTDGEDYYGDVSPFQIGYPIAKYDSRPMLRLPPYYGKDSEDYARAVETVNTYAPPSSIVVGYFFFMTGLSGVGEPLFGDYQENGSGYREDIDLLEFTAGQRFVTVDLEIGEEKVLNLVEEFGITADPNLCKILIEQTNPEVYNFPILRDTSQPWLLTLIGDFSNNMSQTYKIKFISIENPKIVETTFLTVNHA